MLTSLYFMMEFLGALSNMGKFFEHLRENLEALQKDESSAGDREGSQLERRGENSGMDEGDDDVAVLNTSRG